MFSSNSCQYLQNNHNLFGGLVKMKLSDCFLSYMNSELIATVVLVSRKFTTLHNK